MQGPEFSSAVTIVKQFAALEFGTTMEAFEIQEFLRGLLLEPRNLWHATQMGLVTRTETANAVAAHIQQWLMNRPGRAQRQPDAASWDTFAQNLETALFSSRK